jgi:hypothetical protein
MYEAQLFFLNIQPSLHQSRVRKHDHKSQQSVRMMAIRNAMTNSLPIAGTSLLKGLRKRGMMRLSGQTADAARSMTYWNKVTKSR